MDLSGVSERHALIGQWEDAEKRPKNTASNAWYYRVYSRIGIVHYHVPIMAAH